MDDRGFMKVVVAIILQLLNSNLIFSQGDLEHVLRRAENAGVGFILATAGSLSESRETVRFCSSYGYSGPFTHQSFWTQHMDSKKW